MSISFIAVQYHKNAHTYRLLIFKDRLSLREHEMLLRPDKLVNLLFQDNFLIKTPVLLPDLHVSLKTLQLKNSKSLR